MKMLATCFSTAPSEITSSSVIDRAGEAHQPEPRGTAPDEPGHPNGEHSVLQCLHAMRDLDVLENLVANRIWYAYVQAVGVT